MHTFVQPSGDTEYVSVEMHDMKAALRAKQWFGFDLDDTLHDFCGASGAALSTVLERIKEDHQLPMEDMRAVYRKVLADKTATAFTDGRNSHAYRKERFDTMLKEFNMSLEEIYLDALATLYQDALAKVLSLKSGAKELLATLKSQGKMIVIVTEGPQDAQEWTLKKLGIWDYVDFLATTSKLGVSKIDGLLHKVLQTLEIPAVDLAYSGDNWDRDIVPAMAEGVFAIHYSEDDSVSLDSNPLRLNMWQKLEFILTS